MTARRRLGYVTIMKRNPCWQNEGASAVRLLFLLALLVVVAGGTYLKVPGAREKMDASIPGLKDAMARFTSPAEAPPAPDGETATAPAPVVDDATAFQMMVADPTSWPRTVRLVKPVQFPAVVGGKEVGKVMVPAGTEVNLARIKDSQLGVEYQGGGAWLKPTDTDVVSRSRPPAAKPAL